MAKNKTTATQKSVSEFIESLKVESKRKDSYALIECFKKQSGFEPKMWGPSIVGFGSYHYKYESGREGDSPIVAFSPKATAFAIYLSSQFEEREVLLEKLGKYKTEKGCVYIKCVADIDIDILKKIINNQIKHITKMYPVK